ncbi:ATP-dependent RNA helicase [Basidiobolus ranarum]|uniref:chitin synthase n=1 Tax=Basidiobolus ranarum TaxID=34480 RepID=A0ABR2WWH6_9FUNG
MYTLAQTRIATSLPKNPLSTSPTLFSSISQQFSRKFKHNHQLLLDISLALTTYFLLNNPISADCGSPILSGGTTHRTRLHLGYNIPSFRDFCNRYFMLSDSNECAETSHLESLQTIYDAIKQDDVPTLWKLLEEHSYDLNNIRNSNGRTPLSAAVTSNSLKMASYLCSLRPVKLDHKDDEGQTALHYACNFGQVKAAKLLIQAGADVNVKNNEGMTPLIIVAYNGFVSLSTLLLKHGKAKINSRDSTSKSALMMASYAGHFGVVEALIKYKASVDLTDKFGWSALMLAAFSGQHAICSRLLTAGADPSIEALNGKTALDLAFSAGQTKTARLLSKYIKKNNPSFSNKDFTAGTSYGELSIDHPEYSAPSQQRPQQERTNSHINKEFSSSLSDTMQKAVPGYNDPLLAEPDPPSNTYMLQTLYTPAQPHRPPQLPSFSPFVQRMSRSLRRRTLKTLPNRSLPNASRREARDHPNMKTSWDDQLNRDDSPRTSKWRSCSQVLTFCCCNVCLKSLWKMNNPDIIQAWREKAALCLIIILISGFLGFVTFGFAQLVCTKNVPIFPDDVLNRYGPDSKDMQLMIVRGRLYNVRDYFKFQFHRPILPLKDEDLQPLIESLIGKDVSDFFPSDPERSLCKKWPMKTPTCQLLNKDSKLHCHTSRNARRDLEELSISNYVAFSWSRIKDRERKLFVYNEKVYSLEKYLSKNESYFGNINEQLMRFVGRDATLDILRDRNLVELIPCFNDQLLVGKVDGTTLGCFASNVIVITCSTVLFCIIFFKYVCSVLFSWIASRSNNHKSPKTKGMGDMDKSDLTYIIMLVTCYSESEKSIRATLDSLALSTYDDSHKLLFIVCDGDVTGSGNDRSTPDIALSMLEPLDLQLLSPEPMPYISIGQGSKRKNMAKVHVGFYCCQGRRVPMVIVTKCGVGVERKKPKAGNRGKRDSQLILIQWLSKICINGKLTPLEFELFEKIGRLMETSPDKFEIVLMVDADTYVEPDSVTIMVDAMNKDPMVMGLCGETKVANKRKSWVTMIQVQHFCL